MQYFCYRAAEFWDDVTWIKFLAPLTQSLWPFLSLSVRGYCPRQLHFSSFSPAQCIFLSSDLQWNTVYHAFPSVFYFSNQSCLFQRNTNLRTCGRKNTGFDTCSHILWAKYGKLLVRKYAMTTKSHNFSHSHIFTLGFTEIHPSVCA